MTEKGSLRKSFVNLRSIVLLWLAWVLVMMGYQAYIQARFALLTPDYSLLWTPTETRLDSQNDKPYLIEPYLNDHVAWDSEYYLSIAVGGYDDPTMRAIPADYNWDRPQVGLKGDHPDWISMNYAFFPFYPTMIHIVAIPLSVFGLNPIATASLAGVLVSALGTLGAMLALYDLTNPLFSKSAGMRAAFYMLIFPAGFFLLQVYTEGVFLGLSFGALALARRDKWLWAGILAACATWTRPTGILLVLPLFWYWWQNGGWQRLQSSFSPAELGKIVMVGSPLLAILLWRVTLGDQFFTVESHFFGRHVLAFGLSLYEWQQIFIQLAKDSTSTQMKAYYLVEFAAFVFSVITCVLLWRRSRVLAVYSLVTIIFSLTTGVAMGMHRYVMAAPSVFMVPALWGESDVFDRAWMLGNVLVMGVFATMFTFNFWGGLTLGNVEQLHLYKFKDGSQAWIASDTFEPRGLTNGIWENTGIVPDVSVPTRWDLFTEANDPALAKAVELLTK